MNENIYKLAQQGFKFFACNKNKTPATSHGFKDATSDIKKLEKQFNGSSKLIGFPTGNINGIIVIDIDNKEIPTNESFKILQELTTIKKTLAVQTPSGGYHLYYKCKNTELKSKQRFFHKNLPIDIRANGGYVIFPDDENYIIEDEQDGTFDNFLDHISELPIEIENYNKHNKKEIQLEDENIILPKQEVFEIRSALTCLDPDDRDTWIMAGMALKQTQAKNAFNLWTEWSMMSEKYDSVDQIKKWKSFKPSKLTIATLFYEAKKNGFISTYQKPVKIGVENKREIVQPVQDLIPEFPKELFILPGIMGEMFNYILKSCIKEQPLFALSATIAAIGALAGRKYETETGLRTNFYCLSVGASGSGKDAPRQSIKKLFELAQCGHICANEDVASDAAIISSLFKHPSQIMQLDEVARLFNTANNKGRTPHLYNIISLLLKLYSSANTTYTSKAYKTEDSVKINSPNLCLHCTTGHEALYESLTNENIYEGLMSRFCVFISNDIDPPVKRISEIKRTPSQNLIEKINKLYRMNANNNPIGDFDRDLNCNPYVVPFSSDAINTIEQFNTDIREYRKELREQGRPDAIFNRTSMIAQQLALITAISQDMESPIIDQNNINYGIKLAKYLAENMMYIVEKHLAENNYQKEQKKILNFISKKGEATLYEIARSTQHLQSYIRNEILENLCTQNRIKEIKFVRNNRERKSTIKKYAIIKTLK